MDALTLFWLILGGVLIVSELVVPGLVVVFLGVAALLVAGALHLGFIEHWIGSFTTWFVASLGLIVALRGAVQRLFPPEVVRREIDEDTEAFGCEVEVVEAVGPDRSDGRIRFRDATWSARSLKTFLPAGSRARLVFRENLIWVVEACDGRRQLEGKNAEELAEAPIEEAQEPEEGGNGS